MSKNVKGLKELIAVLEKIPKELDVAIEKRLESSAQQIEADAKAKAPVGTPESTGIKGYIGGSLRQSIKSTQTKDKEYTIKANSTGNAPYAAFVEFGTRFMRARPFLYPAFFKNRAEFISNLEDLLQKTFKNR